MSKHFPGSITSLDTGHFINFSVYFCSTSGLPVVFICQDDGNIMETMRHQGLNFALTWNLFPFHTQVGCYFLADALRLIHMKCTHCLELSGGWKGEQEKKDEERSEMLMGFFLTPKWDF